MALISPEEARGQVYGEPANDADLLLKSRAAERIVMQFLNRIVYESQAALDAGKAEAVAEMQAAKAALDAALAASYDDPRDYRAAVLKARVTYARSMAAAQQKADGMVIEDDVKIGMLLVVGHLFLNREAVTSQTVNELPIGLYSILWPHRVGLGV